jgi:SAM-dependent methyltransferase
MMAVMTSGESVSFDKVAAIYDATRGGLDRGERFAPAIAAHLGAGAIFEIGIGTGAIALPLRERLGRTVLGADISTSMLAYAHARLGSTVAVADVARLPVADGTIGSVVASWILHLVGDPASTLQEVRRVLVPGGRLIVVSSRMDLEPDDLDPVMVDLHDVLRGRIDVPDRLIPLATACGLSFMGEHRTEASTWKESPADLIERMEKRQWGALIELDDARFATHVQPVINRLRTLPDLDRPRSRTGRSPLFVFTAL